MASSGFSISSIRSLPTRASQRLNGSALGLGIDWISRKTPSVFQHWIFCSPPAVANSRVRGDKLAPPLEGPSQVRIPFPHLLPVVGRIGGIRQGCDDVRDHKPPLALMNRATDFEFLKQRGAGVGIAFGLTHDDLCSRAPSSCCLRPNRTPTWIDSVSCGPVGNNEAL